MKQNHSVLFYQYEKIKRTTQTRRPINRQTFDDFNLKNKNKEQKDYYYFSFNFEIILMPNCATYKTMLIYQKLPKKALLLINPKPKGKIISEYIKIASTQNFYTVLEYYIRHSMDIKVII